MDSNMRWFIEALRDTCNQALEDGIVGDQMCHIEKVEVTDRGSPILLNVTCFGAYSPTEARRVYKNQGIIDVMDRVARFLADRAVGLKDSFDDLR